MATPPALRTSIWRCVPVAGFSAGGFDHFGRLDALRDHLSTLLGCDVDLVEETAVRARLRQVIEREGVRVF